VNLTKTEDENKKNNSLRFDLENWLNTGLQPFNALFKTLLNEFYTSVSE